MSSGLYALPTLVTGCRPAELTGSVRLRIVDGQLIVDIGGKKVKDGQEQPLRTLIWRLPRDGLVNSKPREEVAAGMEHLNDQTCQYYGSASQSKGKSVVPDKIIGSRTVLNKYRHDPPQRKTRNKTPASR